MNFEGWRKSSYSQSTEGQCVEAGQAPGYVGVRDTKARERGHLAVRTDAWRAFVASVTR